MRQSAGVQMVVKGMQFFAILFLSGALAFATWMWFAMRALPGDVKLGLYWEIVGPYLLAMNVIGLGLVVASFAWNRQAALFGRRPRTTP